MAVLKDLIVHGPSRFIGTTEVTNLKVDKIKAQEGIFKKLVATDADFDSMTANNATVVGLLDVKGELHTNSWTNSNIATIEGSFYITPTISCDSGTFAYDGTNITLTADSNKSFAISSLYINNGDAGGTTIAWSAFSEVLITGQVAINNEKVPLGTIKGKITNTTPTTSKIIINSLTDGKGETSNVLATIGTGSKTFYNIKISLLKRGNTSDTTKALPIGIYMTAVGQNGKTFIDIYGGHNTVSTAIDSVTGDCGGLAKPVLRIGNLAGLPKLPNGTQPAGYGIYTSNGYFTGTIVSTSGTIGNWSITSSSIQTGGFNTANKMYFGTSGISLGTTFSVTNAGELTAKNGTIGGITIGATYLTTNTARTTYNAVTAGLTITSTGIGAGNGTSNTFKVVAATGALYATKADISGEIKATSGYFKNIQIKNSNDAVVANIDSTSKQLTFYYNPSGTTVQKAATFGSDGIILYKNSSKRAAVTNNGLDIFGSDGETKIASYGSTISLASNGASVTIGKVTADNCNAYITPTGFNVRNNTTTIAQFGINATTKLPLIALSDGTRNVYEVKTIGKTGININCIYNMSFPYIANNDGVVVYEDTIYFGRAVSSWTQIILTYKVGNNSNQTVSYTQLPIQDEEGYYRFNVTANGSKAVDIDFGRGEAATSSQIITIVSISFQFDSSITVAENIIGPYASTAYTGPFRVGNGTGTGSNTSNALLADWGGNLKVFGDIALQCNKDSSGGISLGKIISRFQVLTSNYVQISYHCLGKIVMLEIYLDKDTSTAAGGNYISTSLKNYHIPTPITANATGIGFNNGIPIACNIYHGQTDWMLTCRNVGHAALSSTACVGTITYIWNGEYTDGK